MFLDSRILSQPVPKVSCLYLFQTASVAHFLLFPCCTYLQIVFLPRRNIQQCTFYPLSLLCFMSYSFVHSLVVTQSVHLWLRFVAVPSTVTACWQGFHTAEAELGAMPEKNKPCLLQLRIDVGVALNSVYS